MPVNFMEDGMQAWLFTIVEDLPVLEAESAFEIWSEPPYDVSSGEVRRRSDGQPYTPAWRVGDEITVYQPGSQRCVATLRVDSEPEWVDEDDVFTLATTVVAFRANGPTLADVGVLKAVQGGRQRLTRQQHAAARRRIALHSA